MGIARPRRKKRTRRSERRERRKHARERNSQYIIKTKKNITREMVIIIASTIAWTYVLMVIGMFVGAIFNTSSDEMRILKAIVKINNEGLREFMVISVIFFILCFAMLWIWRSYNYNRYGKLHRRTNPPNATNKYMLELELISEIILYKLQNNRVIVLENNPIKDI